MRELEQTGNGKRKIVGYHDEVVEITWDLKNIKITSEGNATPALSSSKNDTQMIGSGESLTSSKI
jgi:hypothetical protein